KAAVGGHRDHEVRSAHRLDRRARVMAVEIRLGVEEEVGFSRLLEQGPRVQAALRGNAPGEIAPDAVGGLAQKAEPAAGEAGELLREPLELRRLRMLRGEVAEQHRDAVARSEAGAERPSLADDAESREH